MLVNINAKWHRLGKIRKLIIEIKYWRIKSKVINNNRRFNLSTLKGNGWVKVINSPSLIINIR